MVDIWGSTTLPIKFPNDFTGVIFMGTEKTKSPHVTNVSGLKNENGF